MNTMTMQLKISQEFTDAPGGRNIKDGPKSGEEFLNTLLLPKLTKAVISNDVLEVDVNDLYGLPHTFLSGSFGKLEEFYPREKLKRHLKIKSDDKQDIKLVSKYFLPPIKK